MQEEEYRPCTYCNAPAELICGQCEDAYYCKAEHQRLDWRKHAINCRSLSQRKQEHRERITSSKSAVFDMISRDKKHSAMAQIKQSIADQTAFLNKRASGDLELQLELGAATFVHIRLLISGKEFSTAQELCTDYFREKHGFLVETGNIKDVAELDEIEDEDERRRQRALTSGKLHLLSSLSNLTHELLRNSLHIIEILISHVEHVYGGQSLELSNVYFSTANYLNFLGQSLKALACFLKCGKLRKELGGTAYFNVALLLNKGSQQTRALYYFQKALELILVENDKANAHIVPQIYECMALINLSLGMTRTMMDHFEKAYFHYQRLQQADKADFIMQLFLLVRRESREESSEDMKMLEFPKERKSKKPTTNISSRNYEKYKNADKPAEEDETKVRDWIVSFKELKVNFKEPSAIKYPVKELEYLFGGELSKNGEEEAPSYLQQSDEMFTLSEGINMDVAYMGSLSSAEVGYLHELNRQLIECKERAAIYDIVENSHFHQALQNAARDKLNQFFRLNPQLVRPSDFDRRMMLDDVEEESQNGYEFDLSDDLKRASSPNLAGQPPASNIGLESLKTIFNP